MKIISKDMKDDDETSNIINFSEIINAENYNQKINIEDVSFNLKLQKKIENVKNVLNSYSIFLIIIKILNWK